MARHKSVAVQNRNLRIAQMVQEGYGLQVVADQFGISRARVSQIVSEYQNVISDDGTRDILIAQLDSAINDHLWPIIREGQPMIATGTGQVIKYPQGHPRAGEVVIDNRVRIDAVGMLIRAHERRAKLSALDRPKAKEKDESKDIQEAMAYLQQLAQEKQELLARLAQYEQHGIEQADVV